MEIERSDLVILIAHYNNTHGLKLSLQSIQEDFLIDIIIVDDGSDIKPNLEDLEKWYKNGNITLQLLERNLGVGVAANKGLELIKQKNYKYIARLDCGDTCLPHKFKKQLDYLENNPSIKLLGTWANMVNEKGELLYVLKHPTEYKDIKKKMYLNSTFINPTVVFNSEVLDKVPGYRYKYRFAAQDYAFFFDIIKHYKAENFPEALLNYEISSNSISTQKRKTQVRNRIDIVLNNFKLSPYVIYSLLRNTILYFLPRDFFRRFKKHS